MDMSWMKGWLAKGVAIYWGSLILLVSLAKYIDKNAGYLKAGLLMLLCGVLLVLFALWVRYLLRRGRQW